MRDFDWYILSSLLSTNNITKSAELLYISQSALTKRLQVIERELGCSLVVRSQKGISFTTEGKKIVQKAERIINTIEEIKRDAAAHVRGERGVISVGVPYSYVRFSMPELLERYIQCYPNVDVDITTALSEDLVKGVQEGKLDVCFARCVVEDDQLLGKHLISQDQTFAVYTKPFDLEDLPKLPYIDFNKTESTSIAIRRWWNEHYSAPQNVRFKVTNADACLAMVEHNLGYGIFPDENYFIHNPKLYVQPLIFRDGTCFTRKTWLVHRTNSLENSVIYNFIRFVTEEYNKDR